MEIKAKRTKILTYNDMINLLEAGLIKAGETYKISDLAPDYSVHFKGWYGETTDSYAEALAELVLAHPTGVKMDWAILNPMDLPPIYAFWDDNETPEGWKEGGVVTAITVDNTGHNVTLTLTANVLSADFDDSGLIPKTDIINDLTTGGTTKVLSAEQGKVLNTKVLDGFGNIESRNNVATPNLNGKTSLGNNLYRLGTAYGGKITLDYNVKTGCLILSGNTLGESTSFETIDIQNVSYTSSLFTIRAFYFSGTITSVGTGGRNGTDVVITSPFTAITFDTPYNTTSNTVTGTINILRLHVHRNTNYDNFKFRVQLEVGSTATPYMIPMRPYADLDLVNTFKQIPVLPASNATTDNQAIRKKQLDDLGALKVNISDIVDNLTSTDTNKPLSANQGKVLDEKKLDKDTSVTTYNKVLVKLANGNPATADLSNIPSGGHVVQRLSNGAIRNMAGNLASRPTTNLFAGVEYFNTDTGKLEVYNGTSWVAYQENLVSGDNIKTVNGNSILGSGDLSIPLTADTLLATMSNGNTFNLSSFSGYSKFRMELVATNDSATTTDIDLDGASRTYTVADFTRKSYSTPTKIWVGSTIGSTYVQDLSNGAITSTANLVEYLNTNYPASSYNIGDKARGQDGATFPVVYYYAIVSTTPVVTYKNVSIKIGNGVFRTINGTQAQFDAPTQTGVIFQAKIYGIV